jgi:hypothetical protein
MAERPNTVAGLIDKRREISGRIEHHQRALNDLITDLDHVDHTIRLFDPDCDVRCGLMVPASEAPRIAALVLSASAEAKMRSGDDTFRSMTIREIRVLESNGGGKFFLLFTLKTGSAPVALDLPRSELAAFAASLLEMLGLSADRAKPSQ